MNELLPDGLIFGSREYWLACRQPGPSSELVELATEQVCRSCGYLLPLDEFRSGRQCKVCTGLLHKFRITRRTYNELLAAQDGKCKICGTEDPGDRLFSVDHDHSCCPKDRMTCGKCIRGLLCPTCNTMLGMAKDRADVLRAAATYLEEYVRGQR